MREREVIQKFLSLLILTSMSLWVSTANAIFTFSDVTYTANSVTFTIDGDMSGYESGVIGGFGGEIAFFSLGYGGDIWTDQLEPGNDVRSTWSRSAFDTETLLAGIGSITGSNFGTNSTVSIYSSELINAAVRNATVTVSFPSNIPILDVTASAPAIYFYWGAGRTDGRDNAVSKLLGTANPSPDVITVLLEEPIHGETHTGIGSLRGWAISPEGIDRVEIYIDGKYMFDAPHGGARTDVEEQHPGITDSDYSGFSLAYGYSNLGVGEHTITARAFTPSEVFEESTSTFSVVAFNKDFIHDSDTVDTSQATATSNGDEVLLENVLIDSRPYDLRLKWRTAEQGFEIIEIR
jgi:hypothetical protein